MRSLVRAPLFEQQRAVAFHVAVVGFHGAAAHHPQPVGARLDQMPVVADENDGAVVIRQRVDQRLAAVDVEMVGRLVEDQQVRRVKRGQRQQQPRLLAARQLGTLVSALSAPKPKVPSRVRRCASVASGISFSM